VNGNTFYWSQDESLADIEKPERIAEIKRKHEQATAEKRQKRKAKNLMSVLADFEVEETTPEGCTICTL
jgi:hypothetical protein